MKIPRPWLLPGVPFYLTGMRLHQFFRRRHAFISRLPVVSVGGILAGGSGKTQVVLALIELLQGLRPLFVLSHGYGRRNAADRIWWTTEAIPDDPLVLGDEPTLIARRLFDGGIGVASDRRSLLARIEKDLPEGALVLLDDGFQTTSIARNCDICLVDDVALDGTLLPSGNLREPVSAILRADIVLVPDNATRNRVIALGVDADNVHTGHVTASGVRSVATGLTALPEHPLLVVGIARPERVLRAVVDMGIATVGEYIYRDHIVYDATIVAEIIAGMRRLDADSVITTSKDAVKLERFVDIRRHLYVLESRFVFENAPRIIDAITMRSIGL